MNRTFAGLASRSTRWAARSTLRVVVGRALTQRQLNRALLARQSLLERAKLSIPKVLERIGGIQAQYAPSSYIGLWSRLSGFERPQLTAALENRLVVQGTLMRATIHLVSASDYWPIAAAIRDGRRAWWLSAARCADARAIELAAERAVALLGERPRKRADLQKTLGVDNITWQGVNVFADLLRIPPSGTWEQRRADLYAAAADWLSESSATPEDGLSLLVRRYLSGFGPGSVKDMANWAGLPQSAFTSTLAAMKLRRFTDADNGDELVDLPGWPLPDPDTPAPPRFMPTWDATLLVHVRRTQILPERFRPRLFSTKTPQSIPSFLIDGQVAGIWREQKGRVELEPFERIAPAAKRALEDEAHRLEALLR